MTPQVRGQMAGQCIELALNVGSIRSYAWRGIRGWSGAECMVPTMHPNNVTNNIVNDDRSTSRLKQSPSVTTRVELHGSRPCSNAGHIESCRRRSIAPCTRPEGIRVRMQADSLTGCVLVGVGSIRSSFASELCWWAAISDNAVGRVRTPNITAMLACIMGCLPHRAIVFWLERGTPKGCKLAARRRAARRCVHS